VDPFLVVVCFLLGFVFSIVGKRRRRRRRKRKK
jgi:uncharacterized membrane protein YdjX (TVP38/TMEM64 family)